VYCTIQAGDGLTMMGAPEISNPRRKRQQMSGPYVISTPPDNNVIVTSVELAGILPSRGQASILRQQ
jgi:hypothetical protein